MTPRQLMPRHRISTCARLRKEIVKEDKDKVPRHNLRVSISSSSPVDFNCVRPYIHPAKRRCASVVQLAGVCGFSRHMAASAARAVSYLFSYSSQPNSMWVTCSLSHTECDFHHGAANLLLEQYWLNRLRSVRSLRVDPAEISCFYQNIH